MERDPGLTAHSFYRIHIVVMRSLMLNHMLWNTFWLLRIIDHIVLLEMFWKNSISGSELQISVFWQTVGLVFELPNNLCVLFVFQVCSDRIAEVSMWFVFFDPLVYVIVLDIVYQWIRVAISDYTDIQLLCMVS